MGWIKLFDVSKGMFPDERAVVICDEPIRSAFVHCESVQEVAGQHYLQVTATDFDDDFVVVILPQVCLETGNVMSFERFRYLAALPSC